MRLTASVGGQALQHEGVPNLPATKRVGGASMHTPLVIQTTTSHS